MRNWNKEAAVALKGNVNNEMKVLNDWCKKNGFDLKKAAMATEDYKNRLLVFEREA